MDIPEALQAEVKELLVQNLMLQVTAAEIASDAPLFGAGGLGLDSVDALQLVVALEKNYGIKVANPQEARELLQSVNTIAAAVQARRAAGQA